MSIQERLLELQSQNLDPVEFRIKARGRQEERKQGLRQHQSLLFDQLRRGGVISLFEEFLEEDLPSLEDYRRRFAEKINSWPTDEFTIGPITPESEYRKWRLYLPGPRQVDDGRWDTALRMHLVRDNDSRHWDEVKLAYDGNRMLIKGEWVTFEGASINENTMRSAIPRIEQALTEAIWTPAHAS